MPASTLDPVETALRTSLMKSNEHANLDNQLTGSAKKALLPDIEFECAGSYKCSVWDVINSKHIVLKSAEKPQNNVAKPEPSETQQDDVLKTAKHELFPIEKVQLGWSNSGDWTVGAGMVNMGNTCYLNSTLQALFHVPSLVNWLVSDKEHISQCLDTGLCIICAMRKTLEESQQHHVSSIRPILIYNKLRLVCRNLIPGRQEDAHEFLRYLIESMEKSFLSRFKNHVKFDTKVKETTPLNQILGGYLRSAVRCLRCNHVSTTFQHFQDLLLDIRKAQTVGEALELYFSREKLDDDSYQCEACQQKVPASKQFSIERAPKVLCIQLKRFSVSNNKITKHVAFKQRLNLTHYARPRPTSPLIYRLVSVVTHVGPTVSCGHYTAVAQAPSGNFYQFDDSMVRSISHNAMLSTNAYIMFYELEPSSVTTKPVTPPKSKVTSTVTEAPATSTPAKSPIILGYNGKKVPVSYGFTSDKVYGPELPPERLGVTSSLSHGKRKAVSSSGSPDVTDESSTESSEEEEGTNKAPSSPSLKEADSSTLVEDPDDELVQVAPDTSSHLSTSVSSLSSPEPSPEVKKVTPSPSKSLVPYETGDTSGSEDSNHSESTRVTTKATGGEWQVTSSTDVTPKHSTNPPLKRNMDISSGSVVSELFKMSTGGYSVPVTTWDGNRSQLHKEVSREKREERKRSYADSTDQGRVKHPKVSSSYNSGKSNPGYNPVQEYHTMKNWAGSNGNSGSNNFHHKAFYNSNRHKRNFHHKPNFHKNYRFR